MINLLNQKILAHEEMKLLNEEEIKEYLKELKSDWQSIKSPFPTGFLEEHFIKLQKQFNFGDFVCAMEFVNKVAEIAEQEEHHPDIAVHYNKVEITLWSHFINGLSINDFIIASKIDQIK